MRESVFETIVGAVVIGVAAIFLFFALNTAGTGGGSDRYPVTAVFDGPVTGISRGTDVRMLGVKSGIVTSVAVDPEQYVARVELMIDDTITLTGDATLKVETDGILGGAFLDLDPGFGMDELPKDGSAELTRNRGAVSLLTLLINFASSQGDSQ